MFEYCEIIRGGVHNRGNIKKIPVQNYDLDYFGKGDIIDAFHSVYMHTEDFLKYDNNGTKRGYSGNIKANYLMWDMDNKHDLSKAYADTIELVERLMMYDKNNIRIYFSGNKGFHVYYICPAELSHSGILTPFNIRNICSLLSEDLSSFDTSIYDVTRVIRTTNSKHSETGLYKIPLSVDDIYKLSVDDVYKLSDKQRQIEYNHSLEMNKDLLGLIENGKTKKEEYVTTTGTDSNKLLEGIKYGFNEGERNSGFASLAGMFHRRNISNDFIYAILSGINDKASDPISSNELQTIINSICRYDVDPKYLPVQSDDIVNIKQASDAWVKIITTNKHTNFGERFGHLNDRMKMVIPGDTIAFVASSGTGKSTLGLELGNMEAESQGKNSLFASLEMSKSGIFFRAATIEATELADTEDYVPSSEVAKTLLSTDSDLMTRVHDRWKNLLIIDKGGLSLDKVVEYFNRAQDMTKGQISNLVIDYFQNLDNVEKIDVFMETSRRLKDVAKQLETKLICLLQTNKSLPDDYTEIQKNHIEGASAVFQAMDYVIAAWKSRDYKNRLHSKLLKDRWGSPDYKFDFVRTGLKYHTEDLLPDAPFSGGL